MDRFAIVLGHYVFCSLHHEGQGSERYERLSRITGYFNPGPLFSETRFLDPTVSGFEEAREVYRALCRKNGVPDPFSVLIAVDRDEDYAPGCFLVCRVSNPAAGPGHYDWDTRDEENTVLIQTDYDFLGVARAFGWTGDDADTAGASAYLAECVEGGRVVEDPGYFEPQKEGD